MKEITKIMYKKYMLNKLRYDFMGFRFNRPMDLSYHHMIVPKRDGGEMSEENGAILVQRTSHDYLHTVERYDYDRFFRITEEMIKENRQGYLDMDNIRVINDVLDSFEREYRGKYTKKGNKIVKPEYINSRILKK